MYVEWIVRKSDEQTHMCCRAKFDCDGEYYTVQTPMNLIEINKESKTNLGCLASDRLDRNELRPVG